MTWHMQAFAAALVLQILPAGPAFAEKGDRDKPTSIEANRMSSDDAKRMSIFEGNVVLTKGTVLVRADGPLSRSVSRTITTGLTDGKWTEVLTGLSEGEQVLVVTLRLPQGTQARSPLSPFRQRRRPSDSVRP
jgi:hypothetical protein